MKLFYVIFFFFFFQAEDGIRDLYVTGVQTCALPICSEGRRSGCAGALEDEDRNLACGLPLVLGVRRERGDRALPPFRALVPGNLTGDHVPFARAVLKLDPRVRPEVVVPARVGRGAAL